MITPESERPLQPGTIIANNYRVTARLGAGGMGTVYLADNVTLSQRVVVKVLRGGQAGAGQEEAQMLANLQHPNVVTVYAHDPALDCIVMEFLDGASLSTLLEKGIDRVNAIRVALAVAEALAAVHRRGLVHRDIKPENVMLALNAGGGGGRLVDWLKLIDFGLALKAGKTPPVLLGTPEFCGPEQFIAQEVAHPANDVYALGITIFLMMTGVFPFDVPREELPQAHLHQPPPGLVEKLVSRFGKDSFDPRTLALLEDLDELLQQMLAKQVGDRPTAQEVARRLTRLESSFADAGTFVGSVAPAITIAEQAAVRRRKASTSVLTRAHVASSSSTAPDVPPVTLRSAPALQSVPAETSAKSNTGLIIALVVLVLVLAGAVAVVGLKPPRPEEERVAEVLPPPEREAPKPVAVPPPPEPIVAVVPEAVVRDAGLPEALPEPVAVPVPPEAPLVVAAIQQPRTPRPPKAAACRFDESFEKAARQSMNDLQRGASAAQKDVLEDLGDELHEAFSQKDCRATEAVLKKMRGVVHASSK